jgi:hypothetical protein
VTRHPLQFHSRLRVLVAIASVQAELNQRKVNFSGAKRREALHHPYVRDIVGPILCEFCGDPKFSLLDESA